MSLMNPYLSFRGDARQAMEFYASVFGGEPTFSTFGELGMNSGPADADLVMHCQLSTPSGFALMASDVPESMPIEAGSAMSISLSGDEYDELSGYWAKLSDGGTVSAPLEKAPWGDTFGMCVDKFGTSWLVNISGTAA